MTRQTALITVFVWLIVVGLACTPTPTPPPPPVTKTPTPPPAQADLQIVNVTVEKGSPPEFYTLATTVRNNGAGLASGFSGKCRYECRTGALTAVETFIVLSSNLPGYSQFTYTEPFFFQCQEAQPTLNLDCTIDIGNAVLESNEGNNQYYATVNLP